MPPTHQERPLLSPTPPSLPKRARPPSPIALGAFTFALALSTTAQALPPAPLRLAKLSDEEKKQQKVDKAVEQYQKKLDKLRASYLDKMSSEQLARKSIDQIEKEKKSFDGPAKALQKAEADASVISGLEKSRDDLLVEILAKHRLASVEVIKSDLKKKLEPRNIERVIDGGDKVAEKDRGLYEKELEKLVALDVPPSEVEALRKERDDVIAADKGAALESNRERARSRIDTTVPAVAPRPGVDAIVVAAPTWCQGVLEGVPASTWNSYSPKAPPNLAEKDFSLDSLDAFGRFTCFDPEFALRQKWAQNFRQHVSNAYRLSAAHNEEIMALVPRVVLDDKFVRDAQEALCKSNPAKTSGTREDIASQHLERIALGCGNRLSRENAFRPWDLDVKDGFKSQMARSAYVAILLPDLRRDWPDDKHYEGAKSSVTNYVIASSIPLDANAFERELKQRTLSPFGVAVARLQFYRTKGIFDDYTRAFEAEAKRTPGLKKLLFEGPKASLAAYEKEQASMKKTMDTVLAVEDRLQNPQAINGCGKSLFKQAEPYLKRVAKEQAGKQPHEVRFSGVEGFLFAYGLTICGLKDEQVPVMDYTFGAFYFAMAPVKGPLTAAYRGMVDGYNAAVGDQKGGSFDASRGSPAAGASALPTPDFNPIEIPEFPASTHGHMSQTDLQFLPAGEVKSIKKSGDDVTITFTTAKWKEPTFSCKDTNKIYRIGIDGRIYYRQTCVKTGMRDVSFTHKPLTVPGWAAGGVKVGALVKFNRYPNAVKPDRGWIVEVFTSKAQTKRTGFLGTEL